MKKIKILNILEQGSVGRIHIYNIKYLTKSGKERDWNMFSRKNTGMFKKCIMAEDKSKNKADGVIICATHKDTGRLVVLREYRVGVNCNLITLPGGIPQNGESYVETAIREFKEETNLDLIHIDKSKGLRPRYSAVGITDETLVTVYGECVGTSTDMQGDNEQGNVLMLSPNEAEEILRSNEYELGGRTELMLELYVLKAVPKKTYVDFNTAMNSGKKIKARKANVIFLTPFEVNEYLNSLNEVVKTAYIEDEWEIEGNEMWEIK